MRTDVDIASSLSCLNSFTGENVLVSGHLEQRRTLDDIPGISVGRDESVISEVDVKSVLVFCNHGLVVACHLASA